MIKVWFKKSISSHKMKVYYIDDPPCPGSYCALEPSVARSTSIMLLGSGWVHLQSVALSRPKEFTWKKVQVIALQQSEQLRIEFMVQVAASYSLSGLMKLALTKEIAYEKLIWLFFERYHTSYLSTSCIRKENLCNTCTYYKRYWRPLPNVW